MNYNFEIELISTLCQTIFIDLIDAQIIWMFSWVLGFILLI